MLINDALKEFVFDCEIRKITKRTTQDEDIVERSIRTSLLMNLNQIPILFSSNALVKQFNLE